MRGIDRASVVLSLLFAASAIFHVVSAISLRASDAPTAERHLVFLAINLVFVAAFALRWRWTIVPAVPLALQQAWSHGADFLAARRGGAWDVMSLGVLLSLPLMIVVAIGLLRRRADYERASS